MPPSLANQLAASDLRLPKDTYIYALARLYGTSSQITHADSAPYCAISSNDTLTTFDPRTLGITAQIRVNVGVTSLCADNGRAVTAGRDGAVRVWDPRTSSAGLTLNTRMRLPRDNHINDVLTLAASGAGVSVLAVQDHVIAAGTESEKEGLADVSVLLWDTRHPTAPIRDYKESHTDSITTLSFSPTNPSTLLSASTDGLVSIFDTTVNDEDDAVLQVLNHHSAVHVAGFLPDLKSGQKVYALSTDEQMSVYDLTSPSETETEDPAEVHVLGDVRARLKSKYVVDVLGSYICSGDTERETIYLTPLGDVLGSEGDDVLDADGTIELAGGHGEEVVRDVALVGDRVLSCGEDGHVRVWALGDESATQDGKSSKKRKKSHQEGYKPY